MKILGIDASSETIGISIVSYDENFNIKLEHIEYYKPLRKGHLLEKLLGVRNFFIKKIEEFKPDEVVLEDILLFMKGGSSAQTITLLSALNRTIGLTVLEKTQKLPYIYNVHFIRKIIKTSTIQPKKEDIPELVAKILDINFPYIKNKRGNIAKENFDIADSIAASLCFVLIEKNNLGHNQEKKKRKKKK